MKMKRVLSALLALVMILPLILPSGGLSIVANAVEANEIENYVSTQKAFTSDQYDTLKGYYDTCVESGYTTNEVPSLERLKAAVSALAGGADYYDDFKNVGEYLGESATDPDTGVTYGKEPENAGEFFPTATNTTNYEILYGGIKAQKYTSATCPSEIRGGYTWTWPYVLSSASNNMGTHHVSNYWYEGSEYNKTYLHGENSTYVKVSTHESLGLYNNWLVLKDSVLNGADGLPVFSVTANSKAVFPRIVYNYIDINNFNYIELYEGYTKMMAVEVKEGVLSRREIAGAQALNSALNWATTPLPALNFNFVWNPTKGCYRLTIIRADNANYQYSMDLKPATLTASMVDNIRLSIRPDQSGAKSNIYKSFKSISFSSSISGYIDSRIRNEVPEIADVKRTDIAALEALLEEINSFGEEIVSQVSNLQKLTDAIAEAKRLQGEYEKEFSLETLFTFEDGNDLPWKDFFTTPNAIEIVENPYKDSVNGSNKVLWGRQGSKTLIAQLGSSVYSVTGKVTGNTLSIVEGNNNVRFTLATENREDGSGKKVTSVKLEYGSAKDGTNIAGDYGNDRCGMPDGVKIASNWINFAIRRTSSNYIIEYGVLGDDGNYYYNTRTMSRANTTQDSAVLSISGNGYIDDLKITELDTDPYFEADGFLNSNAYILNLKPYSQFLSKADEEEYNALIASYQGLSEKAKQAIGQITILKINAINSAWSAIDPAAAEADAKILGYAKENYQMSGSDYARRYRLFTDETNDDSLSQWQIQSSMSGRADIVSDSELGRNVIRLRSNISLTLKNKFLPEKANLSEFSYYIEPVANDLSSVKHYSDTNTTIATPRIRVYVYYRDASNNQYYDFYKSSIRLTTVTNGVSKSSAGPVYAETGSGKFDPSKGVSVSIVYAGGKAKITVTDVAGELIELEQAVSKDAKNVPIIGAFSMDGWRPYQLYNCYFDVRDITIKFAKGDWDDDMTQSDLRVSYTGNTYTAPGDVAVIRGENLGALVSSGKIIPVTNTANPALGYIDRTAYDYAGVEKNEFTQNPTTTKVDWSKAVDIDFVHKSTDSVQFIIPTEFEDGTEWGHGIYAVQLRAVVNGKEKTKVVYLNVPVIDYYLGSDGEIASPGTELEIVGENISPNQNTNKDSVAYELRIKDRDIDDVKVKLVSRENPSVKYDLTVKEITSDYNIVAIIPSEIEVAADGSTSEWELYVYNGYGDDTCWSIPQIIKIGRPLAELRPTNVVDIRDYVDGTTYHYDATAGMQKALTYLDSLGGGTLYMPEGSYRLSYTVYVPENVTIKGDGAALTNITPTFINYNYGDLPAYTGLVITDNCTIEGVAFYLKRARRVVSATSLAENVTLNDVKFYCNYTSWANGSLGQGGNLVDRFELYKYNESQNEDNAYIHGAFENLKMTNILADVNVNGISLMNSYMTECNYGYFENIRYKSGADTGWLRALFSNAVWKNCELGGCAANQARGVYMYNVKFGPSVGYNREIWVADLAGNGGYRYSIYTDPDNGITLENSVYLKISGVLNIKDYAWMAAAHQQIYIVSGNGAGQTAEIVGVDVDKNCLVMAEPFQVPINRNSVTTTRAPREDIYFVDCQFYEGNCPGGFFGGAADVVHDGDHMSYAFNQYYRARSYDVNWYCSMVNSVWENTPYSLIAAYGISKGNSYSFLDDGTNLDNSQVGILIRNNRIENMTIANDARTSGNQKDFIIDNNVLNGMRFVFGGTKAAVPDGLTFYRNRGDELTAYTGGSINPTGVNVLGQTYVTYLDEQGEEQSSLLGDVDMDGSITLKDVTTIHYAVVGEINLTDPQVLLGDVNGDGKITAVDATYIRNYLLETIEKFPADIEPEEPTPPPVVPDETEPDETEPDEDLDVSQGGDSGNGDYSPGYH